MDKKIGSIFLTMFAVVTLSLHAPQLTNNNNAPKAPSKSGNIVASAEPTVTQGEIKAEAYVTPLASSVVSAPVAAYNPGPVTSYPSKGGGFLGAPDYVIQIANIASSQTGMPIQLILAQLYHESGFNPRSVSSTNDYGIAQIHMPKSSVSIEQAFDPNFAINWQAREMNAYFHTYGSWRDALAAYNAGPGGRDRGYGYGYANTILNLAGLN